MLVNDNIYTSNKVPEYKIKRLSFGSNNEFWTIWNDAEHDGLSTVRLAYKLATRMSLQRFNRSEMMMMLIGWYGKHSLAFSPKQLGAIVTSVNDFTAETKRTQKRMEMRRYRAKKKLAKQWASMVAVLAGASNV